MLIKFSRKKKQNSLNNLIYYATDTVVLETNDNAEVLTMGITLFFAVITLFVGSNRVYKQVGLK